MQRRIVVLPDPLRPRSATRSPADSERSKLSTTRRVPNSRQSPSTTRTRSDPEAPSRARAAPGSADRVSTDAISLSLGGSLHFESPHRSFGRDRHAAYPCPQQARVRHSRKSTPRPGGTGDAPSGVQRVRGRRRYGLGICSGPSSALFLPERGIASSPTASSARWLLAGGGRSRTTRDGRAPASTPSGGPPRSASRVTATRSRFRPNPCSTPASPDFRTWSTQRTESSRASTIPASIGVTCCRGRGSSWRRASTGTPRSCSPGPSTSQRSSSNVMGVPPQGRLRVLGRQRACTARTARVSTRRATRPSGSCSSGSGGKSKVDRSWSRLSAGSSRFIQTPA